MKYFFLVVLYNILFEEEYHLEKNKYFPFQHSVQKYSFFMDSLLKNIQNKSNLLLKLEKKQAFIREKIFSS
jgi:hypothetical protein